MKPAVGLLLLLIAAAIVGYALGARAGNGNGGEPAAREEVPPHAGEGAPGGGQTDQGDFGRLVADTRDDAGDDTGRQTQLLEERLRELPPGEIVAFHEQRHKLDERAYTWDVWGAAYVIEDGCSDDCFRDFRAYLISLGPQVYEAAMRDPDSIADVVEDAEAGDWENADDPSPDAYQGVTGDDFPGDDTDLDGDPRGQPWDDDDTESLIQRYPRLAARFR